MKNNKDYFEEQVVNDPDFPCPMPTLSLYQDFLRFGVLPYAGGLRDQDPEDMADFRMIHGIKAEHEERERKKQERKQKGTKR